MKFFHWVVLRLFNKLSETFDNKIMRSLYFMLILAATSISAVSGQKLMNASVYDLGTAVPREAGDNETVVMVKSALELTFESTMDKSVIAYDVKKESGFTIYYLKFSTLPKYRGRKLKIKSEFYETLTYPLALTAKIPLGIFVVDPNGTIGVGCYFEHRNKGNALFDSCNYNEAKTEYFLALECSDIPNENDLSQKIEDASNCEEYKRNADSLFVSKLWDEAKTEYEKVVGYNLKDSYSQSKIAQCVEMIGNLPLIITGKVTDQSGKALEGVTIKAEYVKLDKSGAIKTDNKGVPLKEFKNVGKTESDGRYKITVLNKSKYLEFSKGSIIGSQKYSPAKVEITNQEINISLKQSITLSGTIDILDSATDVVKKFK
jgi:tetratricopeptide (TPR) repeat protein